MKPEWNLSPPGLAQLEEWFNSELDRELEEQFDEFQRVGQDLEALDESLEANAPVSWVIQRLKTGTASPATQARAAELLQDYAFPPKRRPGPRLRQPIDRDELLTLAALDARRIKDLMREHYKKLDPNIAVEFACRRWLWPECYQGSDYETAFHKLVERTHDTLRRPRSRNFGAA